MLSSCLENLRNSCPLIHNITNYVTVNDCANILLACGGSPIMADDCAEVEEITSICDGLNINIGTLNQRTVKSMLLAGKNANKLNHPVLLDPVGAGASSLRTTTAFTLMQNIQFKVIRGNVSEIKVLASQTSSTRGVDANVADSITEQNLNNMVSFIKNFAQHTNSIIAVTGAIDIVSDNSHTYIIRNGHPVMSKITGSGCMLSAMTTAYISANPDNLLEATAASVCAMGLCGEKAFETMKKNNSGNSSFRNYLIDEIYKLEPKTLDEGANYEIR